MATAQATSTDNQYDVFISYCQEDGIDLACIIQGKLEKEYKIFRDQESLHPGEDFNEELTITVESSKIVIVILSPKAFMSEGVFFEIEIAKQKGIKIIPIFFNCEMERPQNDQFGLYDECGGYQGFKWDPLFRPELLKKIEKAVKRFIGPSCCMDRKDGTKSEMARDHSIDVSSTNGLSDQKSEKFTIDGVCIADTGQRGLSQNSKINLKTEYENMLLPPTHWWTKDESYAWHNRVELPLTDTSEKPTKIIPSLSEMLCNKDITRVLIEGESGSGKTTTVNQVAFEWATKPDSCLQKFESVIFIRLDNVAGKSRGLEDLIKQTYNGLVVDEKDCPENLKKILLILDGYDRMPSELKEDVIHVLYKRKFEVMTVIVTSRKGHLPLGIADFEQYFSGRASVDRKFSDRKISLENVSLADKKNFLEKFCPLRTKDYENLENLMSHEKVDVLGCRRMLFMIGVCLQDNNLPVKLKLNGTLTDLFISLLNIMVFKQNPELNDKNFDLFDVKNKKSKQYQKKLGKFGMTCLEHLAGGKSTFTKEEISDIEQLGIMTNQNCSDSYECLHWSFIAFLGAYAIWRKLKKPGRSSVLLSVISYFQKLPWIPELSLTCQFLSGLLQKKVEDFLKKLIESDCKIEKSEIVFWRMVAELSVEAVVKYQLQKSVAKFVPKVIHQAPDPSLARFYRSNFHRDIVEQAIKFHLKRIVFNCHFPLSLPKGPRIPTLDVIVTALNDVEHLAKLRKVQCLLLNYLLKVEPSDDDNVVENCLSTFHSIKARNVKILFLAERLQQGEMLIQDVFETEFCPSSENSICPLRETKFDCTSIHICNTCTQKKRSGISASQPPQLKLVICSHQ